MKITGIVKSAEEITGIKGLKAFEGKYNDKFYHYMISMNDMAGQRIELEEYKGDYGYDYIETKNSCQTNRWQAGWLKDIRTETDWSKVPVDAKVKVKTVKDDLKRHFAKFENGTVHTWDLGETSWTAPNNKFTTSRWSPDEVELVEYYCRWKRTDLMDNEDEPWDTDCGDAFTMIEGSPKENNYKFCPNCGRRIKED